LMENMEQENQHFNGVGWRVIHLILGPLLFGLVYGFFDPPGLTPDGVAVLAVTLWVAVWWITEAIPIAATSLLPIVLFPVTGALGMEEATSAYSHKYIFLYIGGFILAIATERWNLHKRIALNIIYLIGTRAKFILLGFMLATAILSMWISNTAAAVMMLPIGLAIVGQFSLEEEGAVAMRSTFGRTLMLSIAYSASIGGVATLIGTAPNLVLAGIVEELYGIEISFAQWFAVGFPISMCILIVAWWYLARSFNHFERGVLTGGKEKIRGMLTGMGKMGYEEKAVATLFLFAAFAWMTRSFLLTRWIPGLDDAGIALIAALALFIIPASRGTGRALITWEEAVRLPWGILLLFGGGLSIAQGFKLVVWRSGSEGTSLCCRTYPRWSCCWFL
jgi:solute carrier family 13 (sodium-dependent dicarboxylate transporter), member 2/3/5